MFKTNNNTRFMQGFSVAILGIGLLASFPASAEKFYKWVDGEGSTHYTQTPPPKAYSKKSEQVDIVVTQPSSTPPAPLVTDLNQVGNPRTPNNTTGNNSQGTNMNAQPGATQTTTSSSVVPAASVSSPTPANKPNY